MAGKMLPSIYMYLAVRVRGEVVDMEGCSGR